MDAADTRAVLARRKRAELVKQRRQVGKLKPFVAEATRKRRDEINRMKEEIRAGKQKINDERRRNKNIEKELKAAKAADKKREKEAKVNKSCTVAELSAFRKRMLSAVPSVDEMKQFTSKDMSCRREDMSSVWTGLRKHLVMCGAKKFNSVRKARTARVARKPSAEKNVEEKLFKDRPVFIPDIGVDVDEAHYERVNAELFGDRNTPAKKKKKRIAPTFVRAL